MCFDIQIVIVNNVDAFLIHRMNRKKIVSNNNNENSIILSQYNSIYFLKCIIYSLQFVTCESSVDAFSLLYSESLLVKLSLFLFGATFAELLGNLLAHVAALFLTSVCWLLSLHG